jgi:predicted ATPase
MQRRGYPDGASADAGLLERAEQLALLDEALTTVAAGGHGRTALVLGEAGIGKTALLRRFSDSVACSARVLWAACDHLFTPRPLGRS